MTTPRYATNLFTSLDPVDLAEATLDGRVVWRVMENGGFSAGGTGPGGSEAWVVLTRTGDDEYSLVVSLGTTVPVPRQRERDGVFARSKLGALWRAASARAVRAG
jgi:hypothetical protein